MLIDTNASFGHWPFAQLPFDSLRDLDAHFAAQGVERALLSSLDTIFLPDPDSSNLKLIEATRDYPRFVPVPIVNLAMANWREILDAYRESAPLHAVKLYPNFHNYTLASRRCAELVDYLAEHDIRLILNIRMVDERHQYFGLKIKGVPLKQIAAFAQRFPDFHFLCVGLYLPEIQELAKRCENFLTDMSFADWHDLINKLLQSLPAERLVFGSHTPLMNTEANTYKLQAAPISEELKQRIGYANARSFFRLA